MAQQAIPLLASQSGKDENSYKLHLEISEESKIEQVQIKAELGAFLKKGDIVGYSKSQNQQQIKFIMPYSGTITKINSLDLNNITGKKLEVFSMTLCQHQPEKKDPITAEPTSNARVKARLICKKCGQQIWYYFEDKQEEVTLYEFKSKFDDFSLQNVQWNVILNQTFTKNTEIASLDYQAFYLDCCGKICFLENLNNLVSQTEIDPGHIVLKYKKMVCNHEKISNMMCQFCLTPLKDIQLHELRRYLFQIDDDFANNQVFLRGSALSQQQKLFRESIISRKKGLLVLDLDNTILHSIQSSKIPAENLKNIQDYLIIPTQQMKIQIQNKTVVKLRPFFKDFLEKIVPLFEIFIYTKGTRLYAEMVCIAIREKYKDILAGTKNFLSFRTLSRDEDPELHKKKLTFILPSLKDFIVILDDRRQVWDHSPYCLFTKVYNYFYFQLKNSDDENPKAFQWQKGGGSFEELQKNPRVQKQIEQVVLSRLEQQLRKENPETNKCIVQNEQKIQCAKEKVPIIINEKFQKKEQSEKIQGPQKQKIEEPKQSQKFNQQTRQKAIQQRYTIRFSEQKDYFLLFICFTMKKMHWKYFQCLKQQKQNGKKPGFHADMSWIHKQYRKSLLSGMNAIILKNNKPNLHKRAVYLGIKILDQSSKQIPEIVIRVNKMEDKSSGAEQIEQIKKLKQYAQVLKIPIVSESWINLCYEFNYPFSYENYILENPTLSNIYQQNKSYQNIKAELTIEQSIPKLKQSEKQLQRLLDQI